MDKILVDVHCASSKTQARKSPSNPAVAYLQSLRSPSSRKNMTWQLHALARFFGASSLENMQWAKIDEEDLRKLRTYLLDDGASSAKIHNLFCAVRGVAKHAWNLGLIPAEQCMRLSSVRTTGMDVHRQGKILSVQESQKLIAACLSDKSPMGARDAAMIALGIASGMRRAEIVGAKLTDLNLTARMLLVMGIGKRVREVWFSSTVEQYLHDWLAYRGWAGGQSLFCAVIKNTVRTDWALKPNSFTRAVMKRGAQAGIVLTPQDLRRTFATRMLEAGADLDSLRDALGHKSLATTQNYDKRPRNRLKKMAEVIAV